MPWQARWRRWYSRDDCPIATLDGTQYAQGGFARLGFRLASVEVFLMAEAHRSLLASDSTNDESLCFQLMLVEHQTYSSRNGSPDIAHRFGLGWILKVAWIELGMDLVCVIQSYKINNTLLYSSPQGHRSCRDSITLSTPGFIGLSIFGRRTCVYCVLADAASHA